MKVQGKGLGKIRKRRDLSQPQKVEIDWKMLWVTILIFVLVIILPIILVKVFTS